MFINWTNEDTKEIKEQFEVLINAVVVFQISTAKVFIDKYDISASRITTKADGDKVQLFSIDQWKTVR